MKATIVLLTALFAAGCKDEAPCACGHSVTIYTTMLAGKVMIPQWTTYWVCDARIPERCENEDLAR
jgi:hypothetical protein